MQKLSIKTKAALFFYDTRNLVGCALALGGLGMFFAGLIFDWWIPIVIGLYAAGWLAVPSDKELVIKIHQEESQENLVDSIADLVDGAGNRLPAEAIQLLKQIKSTVTDLAPQLFGGGMAMTSVSMLTNAVTRDLPETVQNYLRLPTAFASMHVLENGLTCSNFWCSSWMYCTSKSTRSQKASMQTMLMR